MLSLDEQIAEVSGKLAVDPGNQGLCKHLETLWKLKDYQQQQQQQREEARRQYEDNLLDEALKNIKANPHSQTAKDEWERVLIRTGRKEHVEIDVQCILHTFRSAWQKLAWPFHVGKPAEKGAVDDDDWRGSGHDDWAPDEHLCLFVFAIDAGAAAPLQGIKLRPMAVVKTISNAFR
ncbi:hypothetical protein VOLCADRAFT_95990 [Volvox carteri f. nagariensis]|uniref:Uncharacterized protein n=1 Tax=Volvox carteri f. nagariensis TaxID=3068 RepID=D8U8X2_VOLCA|nr:uncharacterized protein VOLCADRAFT_95990 [Volvox carteri f. nagariensis]EFJ43823.1 hypothetical protein VOLCADRAFT_95990 [Volvox carteri f. nagariensis]|eukprot:XP_002955069.1 hypothetical protein VOLCADRAFT_95990 [Volvox carteri f. nagariensis]